MAKLTLFYFGRSNDGPKYAQTTKLSTSSTHPPLPTLVSKGGSRDYKQRQASPENRPSNVRLVHQTSTPVHRQWEDGASGMYRSSSSNINNNWNQHGGSVRRDMGRRGPLYFQQTSGVLRDSNKFNVSIEFEILV